MWTLRGGDWGIKSSVHVKVELDSIHKALDDNAATKNEMGTQSRGNDPAGTMYAGSASISSFNLAKSC
jgi:hypothetical protein